MPAAESSHAEEDDARLNERILKARSELSELRQIIAKDDRDRLFRESDGPASRTRSRSSHVQQDAKRLPPNDVGCKTLHTLHSSTGKRPIQHPCSEDTVRSDRMRMAELSDEQLTWPSTDNEASAQGCDKISPTNRVGAKLLPRQTMAKDLRAFSTDYVQQALSFDNVTDDDEDEAVLPPPTNTKSKARLTPLVDHELARKYRGTRTPEDLQTYVRQMEETIVQLVQQKDELLRNQSTFDQQIVQGKLLQSGQLHNNEDVATLHEDMLDELRVQREQLSELEADSKRRKYDAELQEQDRAIEISQIKADLISVVANEKMRDERAELMADTVKKLQQEMQEAVKNMSQRYQLLDKRVNQLQTPMTQPRLVGRKSQRRFLCFVSFSVLMGLISLAIEIGK
ncbi:uncharacterized protein PHALS_03367 [Plasmopara halstedii]|uniref:Uncharacterized protein n=1 Tax=Plasmopara halstedii TaxID=4781 RepID=A0A0P1A7S1_PLAHL|nr:uncharacterized protein PHALS_03367 [Plasmopara halstedii]CEG36701.1 hypothetical protein PHALS_03367 [Plasmopara halstedii]|eukprot:XP_024573070.1 hypothetical protein PHALS_03367 [Plasmopara halstedii]